MTNPLTLVLVGPDHVTVLGWERSQALPGGKVFEARAAVRPAGH